MYEEVYSKHLLLLQQYLSVSTDYTHETTTGCSQALARLVTGTHRFDHITPVPYSLHWLYYPHHIAFKVRILTNQMPACSCSWLVPGRASLRSTSRGDLLVPCIHTGTFGIQVSLSLDRVYGMHDQLCYETVRVICHALNICSFWAYNVVAMVDHLWLCTAF